VLKLIDRNSEKERRCCISQRQPPKTSAKLWSLNRLDYEGSGALLAVQTRKLLIPASKVFLTILFLYFVNYNYDLAAGIQSQRQPQLPFIGDTLNGVCTILRLAYR